uniref:Ectonucleoside triphosphate diphosphohydrolase 7 n=1 Tax=Macrostomum lignano TaxID=282301 RepID=A0A1I8GUS9_9PLAT
IPAHAFHCSSSAFKKKYSHSFSFALVFSSVHQATHMTDSDFARWGQISENALAASSRLGRACLKACLLCSVLLIGLLVLRLAAPDAFSALLSGASLRSRLSAAFAFRPAGPVRAASDRLAESRTYYTLNDEHLDLHFGVVIDCGSSGSRLFVYAWPTHSGNEHQLLNIRPLAAPNGKRIVKKPSAAFDYLTPLLDFASSAVPRAKLVETPLYILCTAGMRLLPLASQEAILSNVRLGVKRSYSFLFSDTHAEVISGKQEGVYAWITTNFLLGRFSHSVGDGVGLVSYDGADGHLRKRTVGVIDMGGGSFQIAYEISPEAAAAVPSARDSIAEFNLGCRQSDAQHSHTLYVTTFLGYGANSARQRYEDTLLAAASAPATVVAVGNLTASNATRPARPLAPAPPLTMSPRIADPCLPPGLTVTRAGGALIGTGNFSQCMQRLLPLLGRERPCEQQPCSLLGRHQPPIDFVKTEFIGFSEYWYCMTDVLGMGGHYDYLSYRAAAARYCATGWDQLEKDYRDKKFPKADWHRLKFQCFKSAWILAVLHYGLRFPRNYRRFQSVSAIHGTEVQWTLGAILHRTRYFPLREVQRLELDRQRHRGRRSSSLASTYQYLLLLLSVLLVLLALFRLHRRLDLRRIPSGGYLG